MTTYTIASFYTSQVSDYDKSARNIALVPKCQPKPTVPASQATLREALELLQAGETETVVDMLEFEIETVTTLHGQDFQRAIKQGNVVFWTKSGVIDNAIQSLRAAIIETPAQRIARNPLALTEREKVRRIGVAA